VVMVVIVVVVIVVVVVVVIVVVAKVWELSRRRRGSYQVIGVGMGIIP
jgi:hypothetical protein